MLSPLNTHASSQNALLLIIDRAPELLHHRYGVFNLLHADPLRFITKHQKLSSWVYVEHFPRALGNHDLPTLPHAHHSEDMHPSWRNRISLCNLIMLHKIIDAHVEEVCKSLHILKIGNRFARLPFGNRLSSDAKLVRKPFLCEASTLAQGSNVLRNHTFHTSMNSIMRA